MVRRLRCAAALTAFAIAATSGAPGAVAAQAPVAAAADCNGSPLKDGRVTVNGIALAYTEGPRTGPTIVFLPGMGVPRQSYLRVAGLLCRRFHVILLDQRGQGQSSWAPDGRYRVVDYGADLLAFVRARVPGERIIVSGHSLGGLVALWFAANHPQLTRGLNAEDNPFLMSELPRWERHWVKPMFLQLEQRLRRYHATGRSLRALQQHVAEERMILPRQDVGYIGRVRAMGKLLDGLERRGTLRAASDRARAEAAARRWIAGEPVRNGQFYPQAVLAAIAKASIPVDPAVAHAAVTGSLNAGFDHRAAMARVRAPVLYWNSDQDLVGVLDQAEHDRNAEVMSRHGGACHLVARNVAHLIHGEIPEDYAGALVAYFGDRSSRLRVGYSTFDCLIPSP